MIYSKPTANDGRNYIVLRTTRVYSEDLGKSNYK